MCSSDLPTQVTFSVPDAIPTGVAEVMVTTDGGQDVISQYYDVTADEYVDVAVTADQPVITGFSPSSGFAAFGATPGTSVTITGQHFTDGDTTPVVTFDGTPATLSSAAADGTLEVTVPVGATSGYICVTTDGGTGCSTALFSVTVPAPQIKIGRAHV